MGMPISLGFWEWGCPYPYNNAQRFPNSPREYATLPHIKAKMCHLVEKYLVFSSHFADYVYRIERCVTCLTFHPNLKIFSL